MLYFPIGAPERLISRDRHREKTLRRRFHCSGFLSGPVSVDGMTQQQQQESSPVIATAAGALTDIATGTVTEETAEDTTTNTTTTTAASNYDNQHLHHSPSPAQSYSQSHPLPITPNPRAAIPPADHDNASAAPSVVDLDILTFADLPTEISHLSFTSNQENNNHSIVTCIPFQSSSSSSHRRDHHQLQQPLPQSAPSAIRKTSPGLAARLQALGFGTAKKSTSTVSTSPLNDNIGRLNEEQLRQLDEKHQAASLTSVIVRRGRPWRGASATFSPTQPAADSSDRSVSVSASLPASTTNTDTDLDFHLDLDSPLPDLPQLDPHPSLQLPDINTPEPQAMDTQKYRLPDHINGNGTKATLDLRRDHLERATRPPTDHDEDDDDTPPTPPPKETPPAVTPPSRSGDYAPGLGSYFTPGHNRPGSIYTLSRASFANQLAQLTSLQLPDAELLSSQVSAIPTAQVASKALINAADQIRSWISKASEVIGGLDSDDDVEWSAAGGREGLSEVENAIVRFEELINVYVGAIEELQSRPDIASVPSVDLKRAVSQMEAIIDEWAKIRATLNNVRGQVEIAMEWEELWNNVLGDIQGEMDELSRLVFEMEERRHKSIAAAASGEGVDIGDLETIVEDTPPQTTRFQVQNRISLPIFPLSPSSPGTPGTPNLSQDDSSLLALFARMQPLRASLDFLPMRLSVFQNRADSFFPTACEELEMRRDGLDSSYKKLEKDAESLRKELGEDRWVIVFRGAGRQAQKMHESVERSLLKLQEAVDTGLRLTNPPAMMKKMESYEAKRTHYGPAIERVLSIIDRGVKDRLTVNGEILRLHADLEAKWNSLKHHISDMDATVDQLHMDRRGQQLRDSVSSMLSNDRSTTGSGHATPGSSPPSSVILSSLGLEPYTPAPKQSKTRSSSTHSNVQSSNRRQSSLPAPAPNTTRNATVSRLTPIAGSSINTPSLGSNTQRPGSSLGHRPRWNGSVNTSDIDVGHNFKPLSLTTPSPYAKTTPLTQRSTSSLTPSSGGSRLPQLRSPLSRAFSESPKVEETPTRTGSSRLSFRERLASPGHGQHLLSKPRLLSKSSTSCLSSNRRASFQPSRAPSAAGKSEISRPASSLASTSRRTSLPQPRERRDSNAGRSSPQALAGARMAMRGGKTSELKSSRPVWRP